MPADLRSMVSFLDEFLRTKEIGDWSTACNGLQVESPGKVTRIAAAVDACEEVFHKAIAARADFLLVHHGMFWGPSAPVTGPLYRKLRLLFDSGVALYSSHLPLDLHAEVGNNVLLAKALGLRKPRPFFESKGQLIGIAGELHTTRDELQDRFSQAVGGPVNVAPGGPEKVRTIAIVTGGAGGDVARVAAEGFDAFVTGEGPHFSFTLAEELGINLFYGGHYATETFGVKALAEKLSRKFRVPWEFIDHPTGL